MSRPDKFPDCMALSSKREACLGYRETFTKLDFEEKENVRLRAALTMARAYIEDQPIAHAVVIPRGQHPSGSDPSLLAVIDAALGHQRGEPKP